ncbi:ethanolamine ammonia-lyase subunit EutC [Maledivibacter halophilus]|uniref:Ethanolamine ammonia-lyase small subunit n=1 Tax=Maledivibacter halophilus TaxID=36842 RepID=A0A1T5LZX3_9FIRM|nr:ethanolamine ammonia-lyase subunit EutC [Maledivibacter halophilus]SKC81526.1 Ethanolamine ammonia-lyase light chain [Maledivibacter halophilus]
MISQGDLKNIIKKIVLEMTSEEREFYIPNIPDLTSIDIKKELLVPNPKKKDAYFKFKEATSARVGVWRTGARYKTETLLRFRADHAVAQNAVFTYVSEEFLKEMNLFSVTTMCRDKDEFLTRPDLGRKFDKENEKIILKNCKRKPRVQVYISDGLSSTAIEANAKDTFEALVQGLKGYGIEIGTPFFVKHGRVPAMDMISQLLDAEVTVVLIGERPGLATAGSMSCYMAYRAKPKMAESNRRVVSNIHDGGTLAVEAGAYIADIIKRILEEKTSGLDLKL